MFDKLSVFKKEKESFEEFEKGSLTVWAFYYIPTKIPIDTTFFPTQKYKILYHPTSVF